MVSHVKAIVDIAVRLIAHARVVVQIQVVDAPIVRGQGGDQAGLLLLLLLLGEQLLLEMKPLLHLRLLHAVLGVGSLLFQSELRVSSGLTDDEREERQQNGDRQ